VNKLIIVALPSKLLSSGTLNFGNSAGLFISVYIEAERSGKVPQVKLSTKLTWKCPASGLWHIAATFSFNMNTNDQPCLFQLYHNGSEVWYLTAWYNIAVAGEGITTQCEYLPQPCHWGHS